MMVPRSHGQNGALTAIDLQVTAENLGRLSDLELCFLVEAMLDRVSRIKSGYIRYRSTVRRPNSAPPPIPSGYRSLSRYYAELLVRNAQVPGYWPGFVSLMLALDEELAQLKTYAARRTGTAGYVNEALIERLEYLAEGSPLPRATSQDGANARAMFRAGDDYRDVLWTIANNSMMHRGRCLAKREAEALEKRVDRAYIEVHGEKPGSGWRIPRGWYRAASDSELGKRRRGPTPLRILWRPEASWRPQPDGAW